MSAALEVMLLVRGAPLNLGPEEAPSQRRDYFFGGAAGAWGVVVVGAAPVGPPGIRLNLVRIRAKVG